jgi:hypothetical protein
MAASVFGLLGSAGSYSTSDGVLEPVSFSFFWESFPSGIKLYLSFGWSVHCMSSISYVGGCLAGEALIEIVGDSSILGTRLKNTLSTKL